MTDVLPEQMLRGPADPELFRRSHYGARWYLDPLPADDRWPATDDSWPSVTTIKKAWAKPYRKKLPTGDTVPLDAYWAAEYTIDHLDAIAKLDRDGAMALVATCGGRTLNKAARRGSGVHSVLEDLAVGRQPDLMMVDDAVRPFLPACRAFVAEARPRWVMTEVVAINRTAGYGGTADAIIDIPDVGLCLVDWKTRGGDHGAYEEEAAQLGGYSLAEYVVVIDPATGALERVDLPPVDKALVVSLTADGYRLFPIDLDDARSAFEEMHATWRHHREGTKVARAAIGKPLVLRTTGNPADRQTPSGSPAQALSSGTGEQPAAGSAGAVAPAEGQPAAGPTHASDERVQWARARVAGIVAALEGHPLPSAHPWPSGVPTFKAAAEAGHRHTDTDIDAIASWCDQLETTLQLPFGAPDPAALDDRPVAAAGKSVEPPEAPPAPAAPDTTWADKGRALRALVDDEELFRACAEVARCADVRMTRERYLCLEAVVTQVSDPTGAVEAAYGARGCKVVPSEYAQSRMANGVHPFGKSHALRRAKRLIERLDLGMPSPRSLAIAAADPLLAALVAAGHGVAPDDAAPNSESEKQNT